MRRSSDGPDSTPLAIAQHEGFDMQATTFRYRRGDGQESDFARSFDLGLFAGSALTGTVPLPRDRGLEVIGQGVPATDGPTKEPGATRCTP